MSCNCNAKYDNKVPCCCSTGKPVICTTTVCPDTQPCYNTVETDCVIYTGNNYDCAGIYNSMTITQVIDIILNEVNLIDCTTTTTAPPTCDCYLVINTSPNNEYDYTYTRCLINSAPITLTLLPNQRVYTCSLGPITVSDPAVTVQLLPFTEYYCADKGGTCFNPVSYCNNVTVIGSVNIKYIDVNGILTYTGIISSSVKICAWPGSIEKAAGSGSIIVTPTTNMCLTNDDCIPCLCYDITVPDGKVVQGLTYIDCNDVLQTVGPGSRIAGCAKEIVNYGDGTATLLVDGCCQGGDGCECVLPECFCYTITSGDSFEYSYITCAGVQTEVIQNPAGSVTICARANSVGANSTSPSCPPLCPQVVIAEGTACTGPLDCNCTQGTPIQLGYDKEFAIDACNAPVSTFYVGSNCSPLDIGCFLYSDECLTTSVVSPCDGCGGGYYSNGTTSWQYDDDLGVINAFPCNPTSARCTAIGANLNNPQGYTSSSGDTPGNASFVMENGWFELPAYSYSFDVVSMNLNNNGIDYSPWFATLLIVDYSNLTVGIGVDGFTPFIMNINDWLNAINGVSATGIVFHDNMSTIDVPDTSFTYDIVINVSYGQGGSTYYRYFKLANGVTGWNFGSTPVIPPIPRNDIPWICTSPYVTTTTTFAPPGSGVYEIQNNTPNYTITSTSIIPNSGILSSCLGTISPNSDCSSQHSGFYSPIEIFVTGPGRIRLFVDETGDGSFIQKYCYYNPIFGPSSFYLNSMVIGAIESYSNITIVYDDVPGC